MLDICLLGTGGMMPLPDRWLTSLVIRENGKMLLVDCGEGTQLPLKLLKWGFKSIDNILFTHYHGDHIAGLPGLLLTIGNSDREEPINLIGPKGLKEVVNGLSVLFPQLPYNLRLLELSENEISNFTLDNLKISSIPLDHSLPCIGYSIELARGGKFEVEKALKNNVPQKYWKALQKGESIKTDDIEYTPQMVLGPERKGLKLVYATDTRPTEFLQDAVENSDLFICEGMYGDDEYKEKAVNKKHMLFSEAATLAKNGKVKELWLTHYSPSLSSPQDYLDKTKEIFDNTVLGIDLMEKTLRFEE